MKYTHLLLGLSVSVVCACSDNLTDFIQSDRSIITGNCCRFTNSLTDNPPTSLPSGSRTLLNATGSLQLENRIFTYSGNTWESDLPIVWTDLSGTTDIVALYPTYTDNLYDDLYSKGQLEDILYIKDKFEAGQEIKFQFKHLFSRLTFHISEELQGEIKEIRLTAPVIVDKIIPATADLKLNAEQSHTTITAGDSSESYSFIIPPSENTGLRVELITNHKSFIKELKPQAFLSNYEYACNIKVLDEQSNIGISSAEDLIAFSLLINNKEYNGKSLSDFGFTKDGITTYRLLNDIELTDEDCKRMKPIGMYAKGFNDTFDGQGFTIYNLTPSAFNGKSGLFGYTSVNAIIKNLCINGAKANLQDVTYLGVLVGSNKGNIINCSILNSTIKVTDSSNKLAGIAGGLAGISTGTIINCNVLSCKFQSQTSGGAAGEASGKIINSFFVNNTLVRQGSGGSRGGIYGKGILASSSGSLTVSNCYVDCYTSNKTSFGIITGQDASSYIENCFYRYYEGLSTGVTNGTNLTKYDVNFIDTNGKSVLSSLNEWVDTNSLLHPEYELKHWTSGNEEIPAIFIDIK